MKLSRLRTITIADTSEAFANECYKRGFGCLQSRKSHKVLPIWPGHDVSLGEFGFLDHCKGVANAIIESCQEQEKGKLL